MRKQESKPMENCNFQLQNTPFYSSLIYILLACDKHTKIRRGGSVYYT